MKINSKLTIALCDKRQFSGQNISCDEQIVAQICCFRMQFNAQGSVRTMGYGIYYSHAANYFVMKISFHINSSLTELVSSCHWWYFVFMFKRWQSFNWTLEHDVRASGKRGQEKFISSQWILNEVFVFSFIAQNVFGNRNTNFISRENYNTGEN